jgi:hypothetical protein
MRADGRTSRGERVPVFAGYSTDDGPLADGALAGLAGHGRGPANDAALPPVA